MLMSLWIPTGSLRGGKMDNSRQNYFYGKGKMSIVEVSKEAPQAEKRQ